MGSENSKPKMAMHKGVVVNQSVSTGQPASTPDIYETAEPGVVTTEFPVEIFVM